MIPVRSVALCLDSLFDTRLGTLTLISTDFAAKVGASPRYYRRESDVFSTKEQGELPVETYRAVKKKYALEILRNSMPTRILKFLGELVVAIIESTPTSGKIADVDVHLLTGNYDLSAQEETDLCQMVSQALAGEIRVSVNRIRFDDLTPERMMERYHSVILYDPAVWVDRHDRALRNGICKNLTVYTPNVARVRKLTDAEKRYIELNKIDMATQQEKLCEPLFRLQLCPVGLFSADLPPNK